MSFYTSSLKTHLIDPIYNTSKFQTEFRLNQGTVYLSNMRLCNLGLVSSGNSGLNVLCGNYGIIKSIHLYDGNQLLDQLLEANIWLSFAQYNKNNEQNCNMDTFTAKNHLGYELNNKKAIPCYNTKGATNNSSTTATSWLSLQQVFPFLKASAYVPTNLFKNLRIVINYETDVSKVLQDNAQTITSTLQPLLICDELVNDSSKASVMKSYSPPQWNSIEHDRLVVDEIPAAGPQTKSFTINGFDNKTISRVLIVNSPTENTSDPSPLYGTNGSKTNYKQKIQIRINGANVFARDGIKDINHRLALLTDTWGTCNGITSLPGVVLTNDDSLVDKVRLGNTDYFGCRVNQFVQEFQLEYAREKTANMAISKRYFQQLFLNIFAEVPKAIRVSEGQYNVVYL